MSAFTNNLTEFCSDPDANGNTEAWGAGPHWLKNEVLHHTPFIASGTGLAPRDGSGNPTKGYVPVAYSSNDVMWARAKWRGNIDPNIENDLYVYFSAYIGGGDVVSTHVHLIRGDDGSWVMDDVSAKLSETFAEICGQKAMYNPAFELTWKLYVGAEGASKSRDAGVSESCLYVTYDDPRAQSSGKLYHSVVHIGCKAAQGQTTEQNVFEQIWGKFAGDNICLYSVTIENGVVNDAEAGNELYYYKQAWIQSYSSTQKLLQYKDGTCYAWADFLADTLRCQGIKAISKKIQPNSEVTEWNGHSIYLESLIAQEGEGKHHNVPPKEWQWLDHKIVEYAGFFYDPSYGKKYDTFRDMVDAFSFQYRDYTTSNNTVIIAGTDVDENWLVFGS